MLVIIEAPGKVHRWRTLLAAIGLDATVVATGGHVCRSPPALLPHGIEVSGRTSGLGLRESLRRPAADRLRPVLVAMAAAARSAQRVMLATDADDEGEVIAYDVAAAAEQAGIVGMVLLRLRLQGLTPGSLQEALRTARRWTWAAGAEAAVPGRCRAIFDRAIGALYSSSRGACGRVLTPLLQLLADPRPSREVGEGWFAAAAADLGRHFYARLPLYRGTGWPPGLPVSGWMAGQAVSYRSAGAAGPVRYGFAPPYNTADLLIAASRVGLPPQRSMAALQRLYETGIVSYPRTADRFLRPDAAGSLAPLGQAAGLGAFDATSQGLVSAPPGVHGGLYPLPDGPIPPARLADILTSTAVDLGPLPPDQLAVLRHVGRRALQAGVPTAMERGQYRPAAAVLDPDWSPADRLTWERETRPVPPWPYPASPGLWRWPAASQVLELAVDAGVGRPSTYAAHLAGLEERSLLQQDTAGQVQLSEKGHEWLEASPPWLRPAGLTRKLEALWKRLSQAVGRYVGNLLGAERAIEAVAGQSLELFPGSFTDRLRAAQQPGSAEQSAIPLQPADADLSLDSPPEAPATADLEISVGP